MTFKISSKLFNAIAITIVLSTILTLCTNDPETDESKNVNTNEQTSELPPLTTKEFNVGKLKMTQSGNSVGKKTEVTVLEEALKDSTIDIIQIDWIWTSDVYPDMPMTILYDKIKLYFTLVYRENNVKEEYSNIHTACLLDLISNDRNRFYSRITEYCNESQYNFNNKETRNAKAGEKPQQSEWNASVPVVKNYVKSIAYDASSIEFLEWSKLTRTGEYWVVRAKHRGTNALGGVVTENNWYYIQKGKVVKTKMAN